MYLDFDKLRIDPIQQRKLLNYGGNVYCSKILYNHQPAILDIGIFKLVQFNSEIYLEFTNNDITYNQFNALETYIINTISSDSKRILGTPTSRNNIANLLKSISQLPKSLNNKPYIKLIPSKNIIITLNSAQITDKIFAEYECENLTKEVNVTIHLKKLIYCRDSIILDIRCVKMDFLCSEIKKKEMNFQPINSTIEGALTETIVDTITEATACIAYDELLAANSMIDPNDSSDCSSDH